MFLCTKHGLCLSALSDINEGKGTKYLLSHYHGLSTVPRLESGELKEGMEKPNWQSGCPTSGSPSCFKCTWAEEFTLVLEICLWHFSGVGRFLNSEDLRVPAPICTAVLMNGLGEPSNLSWPRVPDGRSPRFTVQAPEAHRGLETLPRSQSQ